MVGTLAGLESFCRVVFLQREVVSLNLSNLIAHSFHLFVGNLLHTVVKTFLQLTLQQFLVLLREHDNVPVEHLVTVHLQEQRGALLNLTIFSRRLKPCLDAAGQFFVDFHNLLFIHV